MSVGFWQIILVAIIILVVFGAGKLPSAMRDMAKGVKGFKEGLNDDEAAKKSAAVAPTVQKVDPVKKAAVKKVAKKAVKKKTAVKKAAKVKKVAAAKKAPVVKKAAAKKAVKKVATKKAAPKKTAAKKKS